MRTRWKILIEYNGTRYAGWQRQKGSPSIQQKIEDALFSFCQQTIQLSVAGRTDAGVHAKGQTAHFDLDYGTRALSGPSLVRALNAHLREETISILSATPVSEEFHARYGATNKLYTYRILNRPTPSAFDKDTAWHIRRDLDLDAMQEGASYLVGEHDFTSFRAQGCQAKSPIRTLQRLDIKQSSLPQGREIFLHAEARSFLHHQVRNMVGSLVLVGEKKWPPERIKTALDARDRREAGPTCPPQGLFLMRIDYQDPLHTRKSSLLSQNKN